MNRVGDRFLDQFEKSGHFDRPEDLDLVAGLGVKTLRYPVLWERTAPDHPDQRDWSFADDRLARLQSLGVEPIVGLVHHGSGPRYTSLVDEGFAPGLAEHARAVAERYPWIEAYTPVNEPLTTARFSGMYGHWYPHGRDGQTYARALMSEVRATVLSMEAIRQVNPRARLVQTEDLGKTHATEPLRYQAEFENERRWITWDLLCGRVDRNHRMWGELRFDGISEDELQWHLDHPCPPDLLGINHYLTSERFLDHRLERYPAHTHGGNAFDEYADVEAIRVLAGGVDGAAGLLREAWERYNLPIAITECHLGCTREEQARWLTGVWRQAHEAQAAGIDVRAVTVWSMFGAHDWCSLLTREEDRYEPGVFDLRAPEPRPTLLAETVRRLASGVGAEDLGEGWWERPVRLLYPPVVSPPSLLPAIRQTARPMVRARRPLLVAGATALAREFVERCTLRGLDFVSLLSEETDSVLHALENHRPWGVVDASGGLPSGALAAACAEVGARLVAFSSDRVFRDCKEAPYVESDPVCPSDERARHEREVLQALSGAMIVRTGPLFGPLEEDGFAARAERALMAGEAFAAASDLVHSPAYAPDLADAALDLLLDRMAGIVHLANVGALTPAEFARRIARGLGKDEGLVVETRGATSRRAALASERAWVMPTLEDALDRHLSAARPEGRNALPLGFLA